MNRTLRFFSWKEAEWKRRADSWNGRDIRPEYAEGLKAYAARQANICRSLRNSFSYCWQGVDGMITKVDEEIADPDLYYERKGFPRERDVASGEGSSTMGGASGAGPGVVDLSASVVDPSHDIC